MFGIVALAVDQIIRVVNLRTAQAVLQAQWFIALPMLVDHFAHAVGFASPQRGPVLETVFPSILVNRQAGWFPRQEVLRRQRSVDRLELARGIA
jgi:hypothetical protein